MDGCEFESQGEAVKGEILDTLQEQPVDLEKEIEKFLNESGAPYVWCNDEEQKEWCGIIAKHFYELGREHQRTLDADLGSPKYERGFEDGMEYERKNKEQPVCEDDEKYFSMLEGFLNTCWGEYFLLHEREDFQNWIENRLKPVCRKQEVCEGLEEAAEEYASDEMMSGLAERAFKDGARWQAEFDGKSIYKAIKQSYRAGRDFEKEQMMKEAVEGWVARDKNGRITLYEDKPYRDGDKWRGCSWKSSLIYDRFFPNLKWEDEPIKVKVTLTPIK